MQESEIDMCHSAVAGDVGNPANVKRAVKVTVEKYGRIDLKRDMYQAASLAYKPAFATIRGRFDRNTSTSSHPGSLGIISRAKCQLDNAFTNLI